MSSDTDTEQGAESAPVDFNDEMEHLVDGAATLFESLRDIFLKSKQEVVRGAKLGKVRIDVFQLRRDREHFLQRLGEDVYALIEAGALSHPSLSDSLKELSDLDAQIAEYEADMAKLAEEATAPTSASKEDGGSTGPIAAAPSAQAGEDVSDKPEAPVEAPASKKRRGKSKGAKGSAKKL